MKLILQVTLLALVCCWASAVPGEYKPPQGYFQYVNVPGPKEYEFGFNRGNPYHHISRFEQEKGHRFRTRVKWADSHDGHGEHYWEYNHGDKGHHHDHGHHDEYHHPKGDAYGPPAHAYGPPVGYHSENVDVVVPHKKST